MADEKEKLQVNVDLTNFPELAQALDKMCAADQRDRSKFVRFLIQQEMARRQQLELPLTPAPSRSPKGRGEKSLVAG
jgi:metal-responsive CopG/Arc/MetJ family transcriptional regulator